MKPPGILSGRASHDRCSSRQRLGAGRFRIARFSFSLSWLASSPFRVSSPETIGAKGFAQTCVLGSNRVGSTRTAKVLAVQAIVAREADGVDDDALMARVALRDADAFRVLVDAHVRTLHRIAYRMIGDAAEAEDLAQEALLRLWRDAARWQAGTGGSRAWLSRVVVNLCLDRLRRKRFSSDEAVPERADDAPLAPETIDAERKRAATMKAVAALPDRQRAAIVLTYYEQVPNQQAAETMGMNIKAFESLLLRARSALRSALVALRDVDGAEGKA